MMLLERIWENLRKKGEACAYCCEQERISYRQLCQWTGRLCAYFKKALPPGGNPILVYGHKQPLMAVAFLSCAFGGFPFIPVDSSTPFERLKPLWRLLARKQSWRWIRSAVWHFPSCQKKTGGDL